MVKNKKNVWKRQVLQTSQAIDLPAGVFTLPAKELARALYEALMQTTEIKEKKLQRAISMLNYYIEKAGDRLQPKEAERLERARIELRKIFGSK